MHTPSRGTRQPVQEIDPTKHHQKCVCEICTCGKHSCPPKTLPFEGETTNNHYYKPYNLAYDPQERIPYNPEQRHYDPNLIQTTYNSNYTPHRIEKDQQFKLMQQYIPSRGKFQGQTEYKKSYVPNHISMQRPQEIVKYTPNSAKFDGTTTYNREYSPKHAQQHHPSGKHLDYQPRNLPFQGKTTYESEYKPHKIEPYQMEGSRNIYQPKNAKFQGESRYKEEYVPHQVHGAQICPSQLLPPRPTRCSPGKQHLHFTASRNKWE